MEGDDGQPAAGVQTVNGSAEHGRQGVQLAVDGDAQGLEAPLGRVLFLPERGGRHGGAD